MFTAKGSSVITGTFNKGIYELVLTSDYRWIWHLLFKWVKEMRLEKRLFERFLKGVKEWLPSYYDSIVDTATIDDVGYKMGFDKEPAYIFDFELSDEKIK